MIRDLKKETVYKQFSVSSMDMLGLAESGADVCAVCGLFEYIGDTQKTLTGRFTSIERQDASSVMALDLTARRNLELTETLRNKEKKGSLLWVLDSTRTSMARDFLKLILNSRLQVRQELLTDLKLWSSLLKILLYLWKPAIF